MSGNAAQCISLVEASTWPSRGSRDGWHRNIQADSPICQTEWREKHTRVRCPVVDSGRSVAAMKRCSMSILSPTDLRSGRYNRTPKLIRTRWVNSCCPKRRFDNPANRKWTCWHSFRAPLKLRPRRATGKEPDSNGTALAAATRGTCEPSRIEFVQP